MKLHALYLYHYFWPSPYWFEHLQIYVGTVHKNVSKKSTKKKTKTCQTFSTLEKETASEVLNDSDPIRKSAGVEKLV